MGLWWLFSGDYAVGLPAGCVSIWERKAWAAERCSACLEAAILRAVEHIIAQRGFFSRALRCFRIQRQ